MFTSSAEMFDQAWRDLMGPINSISPGGLSHHNVFHGTTCIAIVNQEGVVIAADGRVTGGNTIIGESFEKLITLDSHTVLAISGVPGIAIRMAKIFKTRFQHDYDQIEKRIHPKTKAQIVASAIQANMGSAFAQNLIVLPLLVTYDPKDQPQGKIFFFGIDGTIIDNLPFESVGSGSPTAKVVIDLCLTFSGKSPKKVSLGEELTLKEAKHIAVTSLRLAHRIDNGTGGRILMRTISRNGVNEVDPVEIEGIIKAVDGGELICQ